MALHPPALNFIRVSRSCLPARRTKMSDVHSDIGVRQLAHAPADSESLVAKSLRDLLATLTQDFLPFARQFDDVVCGRARGRRRVCAAGSRRRFEPVPAP